MASMLLLSAIASKTGMWDFFSHFFLSPTYFTFLEEWRGGEERQRAAILLSIRDAELRTSAREQSFESET